MVARSKQRDRRRRLASIRVSAGPDLVVVEFGLADGGSAAYEMSANDAGELLRALPRLLAGWRVEMDGRGGWAITDEPKGG